MSDFINKYPYTDFHEMNLDWIIQKVDELNVNLDELEERVKKASVAAAKEYVDEQIAIVIADFETLQTNFNNLSAKFDSTVAELDTKYNNLVVRTQAQIDLMTARIDAFRYEIEADIKGVNARTDLAIQQNNTYILDQVAKGFVTLRVINYFTGESVTVQDMFDYLAKFHAENAITYTEMAAVGKTFTDYVALGITYTQLAKDGKELFK